MSVHLSVVNLLSCPYISETKQQWSYKQTLATSVIKLQWLQSVDDTYAVTGKLKRRLQLYIIPKVHSCGPAVSFCHVGAILVNKWFLLLYQALNITTHVLKKGGTFVAKVCCLYSQVFACILTNI